MSFYLKFDLFDESTLGESFTNNFKDLKITCSTFGRNNLWIGDEVGFVYKYDQKFTSAMFNAYESMVTHIFQCTERDMIITVGMDSGANDVVKVWNLTKWNKQNNPTVLRTITSFQPGTEFKVTCLYVLNDLSAMVLGLANGRIDLIYSDILFPKRSKNKQLYSLPDVVTTVAISQIDNLLWIFTTTANKLWILAFNEQTNDIKVTLDTEDIGCPLNCSLLIDDLFTVANLKGIYDFYPESFGTVRALDGEKINLYTFKNYLIIVQIIKPSILTGAPASQRRPGATSYQIVIFDHVNKFIAYEFSVTDYEFLFVEWNSIYVYCGDPTNKIIVLTEKDLQNKLKIFFQKNSFSLAIKIAKSQNFYEDDLADMYRQYGDYRYREKNYKEAIDAYIQTIGKLEPSFVIGKYLNISQIPHLATYMEALLQQKDCKGEYVVLLINCYIILKEQTKLSLFIKSHETLHFDIDKVLNLLHKVGFYSEALELASRYERHDWFLKIMIEDLKKYNESIAYISKLPMKETEDALLTYGDTLIGAEPDSLAKQLERVCNKQSDSSLGIMTILKVFVNNRKGLKHFLQRYISKVVTKEENNSIFVDTLIELLLYEVEKESDNDGKSAEEVMQILQRDKLLYHKSKALICCQNRGFTKGYRYLCEQQKNYFEMLESYYLEKNCDGILDTSRRFGNDTSELWVKSFEYLMKLNADEKYLKDVINEIESGGLISPLLLLEKMTDKSHTFDFGLIKDFVLRYYEKNESLIEQYQSEIFKLKDDTKRNIDIVHGLNTEVQVFQNLKCMACNSQLDIPSVHFLCGHSYHMRCFESYVHKGEECPNCTPNNDKFLAEINQWQSEKIVSLAPTTNVSLDKLWCSVLKNARHPIPIDPDKFLSDEMAQSLVSDSSVKSSTFDSTSLCRDSDNVEKPVPKKGTSITSVSSTSSKGHVGHQLREKSSDIAIRPVEKQSQGGQSSLSSSSSVTKNPVHNSSVSNPFETPAQHKYDIPHMKNTLEPSSVKNSPKVARSNKYPDSNNPFEDSSGIKEKNQARTKNPFE